MLVCGCRMTGGMPVSEEMLQEHYQHTLQCMLYWELVMGADADKKLKLSMARIAYFDALQDLHPMLEL